MLDGERRRREEVEKRLQEETVHRQQLIEKEVKLRAKNFSQVRSRRSDKSPLCFYRDCQCNLLIWYNLYYFIYFVISLIWFMVMKNVYTI